MIKRGMKSGGRRLHRPLRQCVVAVMATMAMLLPVVTAPVATAMVVTSSELAPPMNNGCEATAISGSLVVGAGTVNAGGPNFTSGVCRDINIALTSATYRTYARACLEKSGGLDCSGWIFLSYPDKWQVLRPDVLGGTRWQLQMRSENPALERVYFYYTA